MKQESLDHFKLRSAEELYGNADFVVQQELAENWPDQKLNTESTEHYQEEEVKRAVKSTRVDYRHAMVH